VAYDEVVAERVRRILTKYPACVEQKMFGGLAFLLNGHMCCGVVGDEIMVRVGPAAYPSALSRPHTREMDFTGRPFTGFVYVEPEGFATARALRTWIARGARFVLSLPPGNGGRRTARRAP